MGHYYAEMFPDGPDKTDFEALRQQHEEEDKETEQCVKSLQTWQNDKWKCERLKGGRNK